MVGMHFDWSFFGSVGGIVHCSPTLREAGEAFRRYLMMSQPYYATYECKRTAFLDENGMVVEPVVCLPPDQIGEAAAQFELEFRLAKTLRIWDSCGNKSVAQPQVHVALATPAPAHADLYRRLPCASVRFDAEHSHIAAHKDYFCTPFRRYRLPTFRRIIECCERELQDSKVELYWTSKVRSLVYTRFGKPVSIERVRTRC
jgi:hypothetical protein